MTTRIWTAALAVIGDEILSGRTQDRNIAQIAVWLNVQGIRLAEVRVVPDRTAAIVEAVDTLRARNDYLFTTGGIGPTHDDITVDAIAAAFGVPVVFHPQALATLERHYATRGGLTDARSRMARVPEGADLIENRVSGAPGIRLANVFIMAGVPHITAGMLDALTGTLEGGLPVLSRTIGCWVGESEVADLLRAAEKAHANDEGGVAIGSYPFFREGRVGANFVVRATDAALADACIADLTSALETAGREVGRGRNMKETVMRGLPIVLALAAPLAACDPAPRGPTAAATVAPDPMEAKIAALPRTLQQTTLFRAIRDGGYTCQKIIRWEKKPPVNGKATWVAECDDHGQYVIELQRGGVFWVSGVPQTRRR